MAKVSATALTKDIDLNKLVDVRNNIINNSNKLEEIIVGIVNDYCSPLDAMMKKVNDKLLDNIRPSDEELDRMLLDLTSCLYFAGEGVESIGVKRDTSKAFKLEKFNSSMSNASGTVADKTAYAELESQDEYLVNTIYERAYKLAQQKLDAGGEMLSSIKKVISRRMGSYGLSVVDKGGFRNE